LPGDFFDFGPLEDIEIIGIAEIFVERGNKRSYLAFSVQYGLKPFTLSPTGVPTISAAPTDLPPLGVRACQCDSNDVCLDDKVPFHKAKEIRICIHSTPHGSRIVQIGSLFYEMEGIAPQLVFMNDKPASNNTHFNQTTGFRMIESRLDDDFFPEDTDLYNIIARGSATVEAGSGDAAKSDSFFSVELQMIDETRNPTVSQFVRFCQNSTQYVFGCTLH
jgi:hypothetical protein